MRTLLSNVAVASGVALVASCSLINSYDEVKPATDETGGRTSSGGAEETGGRDASAGGTGGAAGSGGTTGTGGTSDGGADSGSGGAEATGGAQGTGGKAIVDSGADAFVPGGDGGAIVAFGGGQLVVLRPTDGAALSQEAIGSVRGIANDVRTDLWYIFEQTGTPSEPMRLRVRELNVETGRWHEVGKNDNVPHPFSRPFLMNGRLAYLSTPTPAAPQPTDATLTILNVENPANITAVGTAQRPLPAGIKQGLVAAPTPAIGGVVTVGILTNNCAAAGADAGAGCDANLVKYSVVGNTVTESVTKTVGRVLSSGNFVFTLDARGAAPAVVVGIPADNPPAVQPGCSQSSVDTGSVFKLAMSDLNSIGSAVSVPTNSERFQGAAYDACFDASFLTTLLADRAIWSVPLAGGTVDKQCQSAGGAGLVLEPYTRTLIRSVQGGAAPEFYSIAGTATAPKVASKTLPQFPRNFIPTILGVREAHRNRTPCPN